MSNNEPTLRPPRGGKRKKGEKERRGEKKNQGHEENSVWNSKSFHILFVLCISKYALSYKGISLDNWIFGFDGILIRARTIEIEDETRADRREEG